MSLSDAAQKQVREMAEQGKDLPESLKMPELMPGCDVYLEQFFELSTDRQLGQFLPGPIPSASIARHTEGWRDSEAERFRKVIRDMDSVFLEQMRPNEKGEPKPKIAGVLTPAIMREKFGKKKG